MVILTPIVLMVVGIPGYLWAHLVGVMIQRSHLEEPRPPRPVLMGRTADLSRALLHVRPGTVGIWRFCDTMGRMKVKHHLIFLVGCNKKGLLSICIYIYNLFNLHTSIHMMYVFACICESRNFCRHYMGVVMIIKYLYKGLYEPGSIKKTCSLNVRRLSCSLFA